MRSSLIPVAALAGVIALVSAPALLGQLLGLVLVAAAVVVGLRWFASAMFRPRRGVGR